jgi:hypothetical protein
MELSGAHRVIIDDRAGETFCKLEAQSVRNADARLFKAMKTALDGIRDAHACRGIADAAAFNGAINHQSLRLPRFLRRAGPRDGQGATWTIARTSRNGRPSSIV